MWWGRILRDNQSLSLSLSLSLGGGPGASEFFCGGTIIYCNHMGVGGTAAAGQKQHAERGRDCQFFLVLSSFLQDTFSTTSLPALTLNEFFFLVIYISNISASKNHSGMHAHPS